MMLLRLATSSQTTPTPPSKRLDNGFRSTVTEVGWEEKAFFCIMTTKINK
jgi:hypothetical protein